MFMLGSVPFLQEAGPRLGLKGCRALDTQPFTYEPRAAGTCWGSWGETPSFRRYGCAHMIVLFTAKKRCRFPTTQPNCSHA